MECGVAFILSSTFSGYEHPNFTGSAAFSTGVVRSGARSVRVNPSASATNHYAVFIDPSVTATTAVSRIAVRFDSLPTVDCFIFASENGVPSINSSGALFQVSDSKIYARTTTVTGATGVSVTTGVWYFIDVRIVVDPITSITVDVQVNGTACGQAFDFAALSVIGDLYAGVIHASTVTADVYFDDLVVSQTSGDYPIGDGFVHAFVPTSDGTHNVAGAADFRRGTTATDILNATTTAYQLVDEVPLDSGTPDTDDYISCFNPPNSTDYVEVKYGAAPSSSTPAEGPRAVEVVYIHHEAGTGFGVSAAKLNDNGTISNVHAAGSVVGGTALRYESKHFATAPSTGVAWTAALFNNLRMRFGFSSDANPDQYFDGTMIEAEFAPVVAGARQRLHIIEED